MAGRVTLRDVAHRAGVSRTTASNVVMGTGRVSDETRERVRHAMDELGYVYHQAAGSLRRRRGRSIGVIVTNIHRPHFGELLIGLESTLAQAGYTCLVISTRDDLARQADAVRTLREYDVAGLAMIPATGSDETLTSTLDEWGIPAVFMTRYVRGIDFPYVGPDDVAGGRAAAEHLLDHGCRSIAYFGGYAVVNSRIDRLAGVRAAIAERDPGVRLVDLESEPTGEGGLALGRALIEEGELPDGILCHGDAVAMGLERALHDAGRQAEVRVVGYDGVAATEFFIPSITSVATNGGQLGELAARALLEAFETGDAPRGSRPVPPLIVRESCGEHSRIGMD